MHSNKMKTYELTLTETQKRWINQHCLIHLFSSIIQDPNSSLMCFFSIGQGHLCLDKIKVLLVKMEEGGKIDVRQPNAPATLLVKSMVISSYPTSLPAHKKGRGPERLLGKRKWNQQSTIKTRKKIPLTETNRERLLFLMTVMSSQNNSITLGNSYFTSNLTEHARAALHVGQLFPTDQDSSCQGGGVANNRQQLWLNHCRQEFRRKAVGINGHVVQPVFFFFFFN